MMTLKVFTDGGARGNPGPAATGVVVKDESGLILEKFGRYLGKTTNNVAEYQAVIDGLKICKSILIKSNFTKASFFIDSQLVVQQLNGIFKVKDQNLKTLFIEIKQLELNLPPIEYNQIPRSQNKEADFLVNKTLNQQLEWT